MYVKRSRHAKRSEATRAALVAAARGLFAERGFGGVGTEEIVRAAGVTRGALYHQFDGKAELFAAVFEQLEAELAQRVAKAAAAAQDPVAELRVGAEAWLDACAEAEVRRIALLDAPAVLGFERWREIGLRYGLGLVEGALRVAMEGGHLPRGPAAPLAHVLIGALDAAALYIATAEDPAAARTEVGGVLDRVIAGLTTS
jgi:AcrR family transcriptional regulator